MRALETGVGYHSLKTYSKNKMPDSTELLTYSNVVP